MCFIHIMSTVLQTGYLPSFDCKLEGGKEGGAPPQPPYPGWAARAPFAVISSPGVCVWGGGDQLVTGGGAGMRAKYSPPIEMTPDWGEEGATRHVCIELLLTD